MPFSLVNPFIADDNNWSDQLVSKGKENNNNHRKECLKNWKEVHWFSHPKLISLLVFKLLKYTFQGVKNQKKVSVKATKMGHI